MKKKTSTDESYSLHCNICKRVLPDCYIVKDRVWIKEAKQDKDGMLCLNCLEKVIGRKLTIKDFKKVPLTDLIWYGYKLAKRES